jgi:energy-coupling factor transporter ATP-binding protein EcfA2
MDLTRIDLGPERDRRSVVELIGQGVLDGRLAALAWLLVERGVPLVVAAGPSGTGKTVLLRALLAFLPEETRVRTIAGAWETWGWLPAELRSELGVPGIADVGTELTPSSRSGVEIVVPEFSAHLPLYTWGAGARTAIRLASRGYGLAGSVHGESLEDVFAVLGGPEVGATVDELSHLGLVLIVRAVDAGLGSRSRRRVVAAHYLRPLARDVHGHVQRLDPAVIATWDATADAFEDFAWGVVPEIAARLERSSGEVERDRERRAAYLDALVAAGTEDETGVAAAIAAYQA